MRIELGYRIAYQDAVTGGFGVTAYDRGKAALK